MRFFKFIAAVAVFVTLASCASYDKVPYFQDLNSEANLPTLNATDYTLRLAPADMINIVVSSALSPEIATSFNLPLQSNRIGAPVGQVGAQSTQSTMPYLIDSNGDIDFPVVGKIRVAGSTREEVETIIKNILVEQKLLNDAVVTCQVMNQYINVIGDVKTPGRIQIDKDNLTIVEALAKCGDLNITGERHNVTVIRRVGDQQKVYHVDLTSAQNVFGSPVYYLLPNDIVYVNPNKTKQRTSTPNGNTWQSPLIYISTFSMLMSIATTIVALTK